MDPRRRVLIAHPLYPEEEADHQLLTDHGWLCVCDGCLTALERAYGAVRAATVAAQNAPRRNGGSDE